MKILAIDYGSKKIGLATADSELKIAVPHQPISYQNKKELLRKIRRIVQKEEIAKIILGLPLSFSFQETKISEEVRKFGKELEQVIKLPVELENEVLSSKEAESHQEAIWRKVKKRKQRQKIDLDSQAAVVILDGYLKKMSTK